MKRALILIFTLLFSVEVYAESKTIEDLPLVTSKQLQSENDFDQRNILKEPSCYADTSKCDFIHELIVLECLLDTPLKETEKKYDVIFWSNEDTVVRPSWYDVELNFRKVQTYKNPSNIWWIHKIFLNEQEDILNINRETLLFTATRSIDGTLLESQTGNCTLQNTKDFIFDKFLDEATRSYRNRKF